MIFIKKLTAISIFIMSCMLTACGAKTKTFEIDGEKIEANIININQQIKEKFSTKDIYENEYAKFYVVNISKIGKLSVWTESDLDTAIQLISPDDYNYIETFGRYGRDVPIKNLYLIGDEEDIDDGVYLNGIASAYCRPGEYIIAIGSDKHGDYKLCIDFEELENGTDIVYFDEENIICPVIEAGNSIKLDDLDFFTVNVPKDGKISIYTDNPDAEMVILGQYTYLNTRNSITISVPTGRLFIYARNFGKYKIHTEFEPLDNGQEIIKTISDSGFMVSYDPYKLKAGETVNRKFSTTRSASYIIDLPQAGIVTVERNENTIISCRLLKFENGVLFDNKMYFSSGDAVSAGKAIISIYTEKEESELHDYTLKVNVEPIPYGHEVVEVGREMILCKRAKLGAWNFGTFENEDDEEYYIIDVPEAGEIIFSYSSQNGGVNYGYDATGYILREDGAIDEKSGVETSHHEYVRAGKIIANIHHWNGELGNYAMKLDLKPLPENTEAVALRDHDSEEMYVRTARIIRDGETITDSFDYFAERRYIFIAPENTSGKLEFTLQSEIEMTPFPLYLKKGMGLEGFEMEDLVFTAVLINKEYGNVFRDDSVYGRISSLTDIYTSDSDTIAGSKSVYYDRRGEKILITVHWFGGADTEYTLTVNFVPN